jgi:amino acid adenylation domain-containing protein
METVAEFLTKLASRSVKLSVEAGEITCYAKKGMLTHDIEEGIIKYKPQLVALLEGKKKRPQAQNGEDPARTFKEFPLSVGEKGLYILQKLHPEMSAYNVPLCFRINSEVNVEVLAQAWNYVLEQFPILTARVLERDGILFHLLDDGCKTTIQQQSIDVEDDKQFLSFLQKRSKVPFDLNRGPLTRIELFTQGTRKSVLLLTVHHMVFDGTSAVILMSCFSAFYQQLSEGKPVRLIRDLPGYQQFVAWEQNMLASAEGESHAGYWRQQLDGELPQIGLLADLARPASSGFVGKTLVEDLPEKLSHWVRDFATAHSLLPSVIFLAVFKLLLRRYTSQDDIIVGMPIIGRAGQKFATEVGYFINMVPLRTQCDERLKLSEWLRRVQGTMLDAVYHASYPFPLMLENLKSTRAGKTPVFQITYAYQNFVKRAGFTASQQQGLYIENVPEIAQEGDFDLGLEVFEHTASHTLHLKYNPEVYVEETAKEFVAHYRTLLTEISESPNLPLHEYPIITEQEKHRLLVDYNDTRVDYPNNKCIHELFVEQVAIHAGKTAVVCGDKRLTYQQLYDRSRDLALYLQSQGVGPDSLVILCMERSLDMVVGLLGILRAGGAYVPLDPDHPDEHLAYMLQDSQAAIVVTDGKVEARVASLVAGHARLVTLDQQWPEIIRRVAELKARNVDLHQEVKPHNLAYVIYTSGSTGRAKGVMVEHRSVVRLVCNTDYVRLGPEDVIAQASNISFDAATFEVWGALLTGARVVIIGKDALLSPAMLAQQLRHNGVTTMFLTTALFNQVACDAVEVFSGLRYLLFGGERVEPRWVARVLKNARVRHLLHVYGPTETVTFATWHEVKTVEEGRTVPIGRPIANTSAYILDAHLRPVPVGVAGELYIGGPGVARGYLKRPELTAERFVQDPFVKETGSRMYKTGDLARWLRDGAIEFLGRNDHQVKIRGFRVELGEIEARLSEYPGVREVVVLVREDEPGNKRLVAYYATAAEMDVQQTGRAPEVAVSAEQLRAYLAQKLPEYMVPAAYVRMVQLPLTINGKVDRSALPEPEGDAYATREYEAPQGELESRLAEIWTEVLKLEPVGRHDSFFELGGHSLLATQLISKMRSRFEIDLPLKALFEQPTVAQLARLIARTEKNNDVPPIRPVDRAKFDRLPLSFAQERLWFIHQLEPGSVAYNVPGAVILHGDLDVSQLDQALNLIIARHENLRTVFPSEDGQARQLILDSLDFKLERIDLSRCETREERDNQARQLCLSDAAAPFDLARGPLLRGKVIKLAGHEHILMLNMHHIVSDGWSLGVLIKELGLAMEALRQGRSPELDPLPIQYVDYSVWQRTWLEEGGILNQQLAYWQMKLAGAPESLDLATDYPRPAIQSFAGATRAFSLSAQLTGLLKHFAEQQGGTLYMALLAAFKILLYRYTGQSDICVGTPIANRQYGETEGLIGMFVNTLALRTWVEGEDTFSALLAKIKATCLEAYEHQDAPFEKVVDLVRPRHNMAISPLFQIMVILQNVDMGEPDPHIQPYPLATGISKFDISVEFRETTEGLAGSIEYSTALYKPQSIERMVDHFLALCEAVVAAPAARIHELSYMRDEEKDRLLLQFNDTCAGYSRDRCVHELFAEQVARDGDKTALVCGDGRLTYRELHARSRDLALYLQSMGVKPDTLVAVCMERSLDMVVGLLGILQAGGAYVPLDPGYPDERLAHMLQDSRAAIVLTDGKLEGKVSSLLGQDTRLVILDKQWSDLIQCVAELTAGNIELRREVRPQHLAYVIYTSGSTGQPRGVMVEHRNLANLVGWHRTAFGLGDSDVSTSLAGVGFDATAWEIWPSLCAGGILMSPSPEVQRNPEALLQWWEKLPVDVSFLPTPLAELAFSQGISNAHLRMLLVGGDRLHRLPPHPERFLLINNYGPTECTVVATSGVLQGSTEVLHIGRPISNTQIYILDAHRQPVPAGVSGEIYIGGASVARGYLNQPKLTAERFVANPFSGDTDARMYRTGDLARWMDDGNIQYMGRIDTQVKVRGFRIELGEIEARLNQHPGIQDNAVIAQGQEGNRVLVAFYRAKDSAADRLVHLPCDELREHLSKTLPEYMVPAAFVSLAAIPSTPNGKVDRRALALMEVTIESAEEYVAPRNDTEKQLVEIWAQVLKRAPNKIGVSDNFFDLGGHSLLALPLMAKINKRFKQLLPLAVMFTAPNIAALAKVISNAEAASVDILVPIQPGGDAPPVFGVPGAGGNVLSLQPLSRALGPKQPFYGLQAVGLDGKTLPLNSVEQTAEVNITAMKALQPLGPYRLIGHSYGGVVAFEMARILLEQGQVTSLILLDSLAPAIMQGKAVNDEATELFDAGTAVANMHGATLDIDTERLGQSSNEENVRYIVSLFEDLGLEINADQLTVFQKVFQANQMCYRAYKPSMAALNFDVSLYRAMQGHQEVPPLPRDYGWNELLKSPIRVFDVEANHFSILEKAPLQIVAAGV